MSKQPKTVVMHVGLQKCGSTMLQNEVFAKLPTDLVYYSNRKVSDDPIVEFLKPLNRTNRMDTVDVAAHQRDVRNFLESLEQPTVIASREATAGNAWHSMVNSRINADMIKAVIPEAKIFMVVRRQDTWVESLYKHTLKLGLSIPVNRFLNYHHGQFSPYEHYFIDGRIDVRMSFLKLVQYYQSIFPNVLVLPLEMLRDNPNGFLDRMYEFADIPGPGRFYPNWDEVTINRAYSLHSTFIAYWYNRLRPQPKRSSRLRYFLADTLDQWLYIPHQSISPQKRKQLLALHESDNRQLAERIGIDLGRYGYY